MKSTHFLEELQRQFEEDFQSQIPELFDIVFDINGMKLYAHRYRLSTVSSTFKSMLSDRWSSKNEAIPIKDYKFKDFKELLTFIYSGKCSFNDTNIFTILDMAEYYQISHLKELCDEYLSKMELNLSNSLKVLEICNKYSLTKVKETIAAFIIQNFTTLKCNKFLNAVDIKEIVTIFATKPHPKKHENLFLCVYEWAENQANLKKQQLPNNVNFNMNDAIKAEMQAFLPLFKFKKMESSFLRKFVVQKGFLFTDEEFADILEYSKSYFKVKITNNLCQSIFGVLSKENKDTMEFIKTISHSESANYYNFYIYWNLKHRLPSTPSLLKKRDGVSWYLIYFCDYIGVKHSSKITVHDVLLAEMFAERSFEITEKSKIEIE